MTDNKDWPEELNYNSPYGTHEISTLKEEANGWHSGRTEISEFQGSHTLPRASGGGNKTKKTNRNKVCQVSMIYLNRKFPKIYSMNFILNESSKILYLFL